jgi:hypothetical protein
LSKSRDGGTEIEGKFERSATSPLLVLNRRGVA